MGQRLLESHRQKKNAHWDVYASDVTAIAVRTSGSAITLDLPT